MEHKHLATQHRLSKWFLALFVCLGFFVFAGGLSNVQPGQHRVVQTELIFNTAQTNNKKFIFYYNKLSWLNKFNSNWSTTSQSIILINHQRSLQRALKWLQQSYLNWITFYFSPLKTIPQNFKEKSIHFLVG